MSFWKELKRRNVVKVAIAYLAAAWLLIQVAAIVVPAFDLPGWTMRAVLALSAAGFALTVMLAWIYDLTPEGIRRTDDRTVAGGSYGLNGRKLDFMIIGFLSLALIAVAFDRYWLDDGAGTIDSFLDEATIELVSDFPGAHSEPILSPDGTMIAFVSDASGSSQIWVKDLAQGEPIQITDAEVDSLSPTWSPRNDQILFQRRSEGPVSSIYSVGPLGTPEARLLVERGLAPSFGGDGRRFVYANGRQIWIADADGSNRRQLEGIPQSTGFAAREPALSPDGTRVAFVHGELGPDGEIWVVPVDGGEARQLTNHGELASLTGSPSWSHDGRYVLYTMGGLGSQHLWRVDVESAESAPLTTGTGGYDSPRMSSDGRTLVYTNHRSVWHLMRSDATGSHTPILESRNPILSPQVSPDGSSVAFFTQLATGIHIFTVGIDGEDLRQLTFDEGGVNTLPTWSANEDVIYYYRSESLHRMSPAGGPSVEVLPDFHWSSRAWLAVYGNRIAYHEYGIEPGVQRTVIRNLDTGEERELPASPVWDLKWSRDGSELIGRLPNFDLVICTVEDLTCETLTGTAGPIGGEHPRWSADESRIFFHRGSFERISHRTLWVVDRNGQNLTRLFEYGPIGDGYYMSIGRNDELVWNQTDRGTDEIWVARKR